MTHSTAEAEYVAADTATRKVMWFRSLKLSWEEKQNAAKIIYEDNMACLSLFKGEGRYFTSKHIGIRHVYIKEKVDGEEIILKYVPTDDQLADVMMKSLPPCKFNKFMSHLVCQLN